MNTLIIKLNATGDVVRTTTLLRRLEGEVTWITASRNMILFDGCSERVRCLEWNGRDRALDRGYDLVINLEDELETAEFARAIRANERFGAWVRDDGRLTYTDSAKAWFDLSLISAHGREAADRLKLQNRRTYQDLLFEGLGFRFDGERYILPRAAETPLRGDVAIAAESGPVWPMKKWAWYPELKERLEGAGLKVNYLPQRGSLLEHLGDVRNHRCLVGGDSLPMHLALGSGVPCVSIFTCTSPWEIYDFGIQTKLISPLLEEFWYKRGFDERATTAISLDEVFDAVADRLHGAERAGQREAEAV